jgi:hypothetical protein
VVCFALPDCAQLSLVDLVYIEQLLNHYLCRYYFPVDATEAIPQGGVCLVNAHRRIYPPILAHTGKPSCQKPLATKANGKFQEYCSRLDRFQRFAVYIRNNRYLSDGKLPRPLSLLNSH